MPIERQCRVGSVSRADTGDGSTDISEGDLRLITLHCSSCKIILEFKIYSNICPYFNELYLRRREQNMGPPTNGKNSAMTIDE